MDQAFHAAAEGWTNFYVILGAAAGALTGLMFVAMTLIADLGDHSSTANEQVSAFGTPTIVHFVAPLVLAAVLTAPWRHLAPVAVLLKCLGALGVLYAMTVFWFSRKQRGYLPDVSDWLCYAILPLVAYVGLIISAFFLSVNVEAALFGVGGVALALLLLAIRNAWDTVTFIAVKRNQRKNS